MAEYCKDFRSPNCDERPSGLSIDTLVLHYTGMQSCEEALERLCDPRAKVSAHYLVQEDGAIYAMVDEKKRAWHAGLSKWRGRASVNDFSIGIEIANPGHEFGYVPFPKKQMVAVKELCKDIFSRHNIPARNIVAHSDVAPDRKEDPGELFDWQYLAENGIGLWPKLEQCEDYVLFKRGDEGEGVRKMQQLLARFGYDIAVDGAFGTSVESVVKAFQRHFSGADAEIDGAWSKRQQNMLEALLG